MIRIIGEDYEKFVFPCGEINIKISQEQKGKVHIRFDFESCDEIIELMLICDAVKRRGDTLNLLSLPYIPFSRQDRVCNKGEAFSLKVFADLINSLNFKCVVVYDPHSIVSTALINNCKHLSQYGVFKYNFYAPEYYIISPDGGALKKIYDFSKSDGLIDIVECTKKRNLATGEIEKTVVYKDDFKGKPCYIIDDICDGGRTFIEIAKILKKRNAGKVILMVTHGFFTKGLEVFDNLIDEIYTRKGKIK